MATKPAAGAPPFLRLIRFSLAPTVLADVCAGVAAAGVDLDRAPGVLPIAALCSLFLFVGGMAWNDFLDREEDGRSRPSRPLPAGELLPRVALVTAALGLLGAPLLAWILLSRLLAGWVSLLALSILAYHSPLRRFGVLGPVLLGWIRGCDLFLGVLLVLPFDEALRQAGPLAASYALYVCGASFVAREEDRPLPRWAWIHTGLAVSFLAVLSVAVGAGFWRNVAWNRSVLLLVLGLLVLRPILPLYREVRAQDAPVAKLAGGLLGRMSLIAALVAFAAGGMYAGALCLGVALLVRRLVRWVPPT